MDGSTENDTNYVQMVDFEYDVSDTDNTMKTINGEPGCVSICKKSSFWIRISVLFLALILFFLSLGYCIGQSLEPKLGLITKCDSPKTNSTIWYHSFLNSLHGNNDKPQINWETQFGLTDDPCWTTKKIDINTDSLWYYNKYTVQWKQNIDAKSVFFGIISFYCFLIICYGSITLSLDIISSLKHTQTQCQLFTSFHSTSSKYAIVRIYDQCTKNDTTGWVILKLFHELLEIILQSQALLLYNGYHILFNDVDDIYLANKAEFIIIFAYILSFNIFGSGILWLFYIILPGQCKGITFNRSHFFVDKFSDLLYAIFPLIILYFDDYNRSPDDILVWLGQLNMNSSLAFLSTFVPLMFLCHKCLLITISANKSIDVFDTSEHKSWAVSIWKRIFLCFIAILLIVYGIVVLVMVYNHIETAQEYCSSIKESKYFVNGSKIYNVLELSSHEKHMFDNNAELFLWDKCIFKVYPFTKKNERRCQCRVLVIDDWRDAGMNSCYADRNQQLNLTQDKILTGMLSNWVMLEKFRTCYVEADSSLSFEFFHSMFNAKFMKAFEWKSAPISYMSDGISNWQYLEYLKLEETLKIVSLPTDFYKLSRMKYLSLSFTGLTEFSVQICALTKLKILQFEWNTIDTVPQCIINLQSLEQFILDGAIKLEYIPLTIFELPHLYELSLFQSQINYPSLLEYNLPMDISLNDSIAINEWFDTNLKWNNETDYYLQLNPICSTNINAFPTKLQAFMSVAACDYDCLDTQEAKFCSPSILGDGRCDIKCHVPSCTFDMGDCIQLCFAPASKYTNCSWDLFTNDVCDTGCDNEYCASYRYESDFTTTFTVTDDGYLNTDNMHCENLNVSWSSVDDMNKNDDNYYNQTAKCLESSLRSIYLDENALNEWKYCSSGWIGDSFCDDACRTEDCLQDGGDCPGNCQDDVCLQVYQAWLFFAGTSTFNANNTVVCRDWWPQAIAFFGKTPDISCEQQIAFSDFNGDGYTNFREFIPTAIPFVVVGEWLHKSTQVNCSSCVGMEHYNPRYDSQ